MKGAGENCSCCKIDPQRLIVVRGAVVCPVCDNVTGWPKPVGATT